MQGTLLGGRYRLGPVIGVGGTGAVHRAHDEMLGREVAVKVLRVGAAASESERLRREIENLGSVRHSHLVAMLDAGAGDAVWFAMELLNGPDLRTLLRDRGPMEGPAVRRLLRGIVGALGAMHEAGLVHRDVTPSNILLTADPFARWEAKLADLGIARRPLAAPLTDVGLIVGTAAYLSPEQVAGGEIGPATDIYALALVALEALTGRTPFPGSRVESATARLLRPPDVPDELCGDWQDLLRSATAMNPLLRPSAADLVVRVEALPDTAWARPQRRAPVDPTRPVANDLSTTAMLPPLATSVLDAPSLEPHRRRHARATGAAILVLIGVIAAGSTLLVISKPTSSGTVVGAAVATAAPASATASTPRQSTAAARDDPVRGRPSGPTAPDAGSRVPVPDDPPGGPVVEPVTPVEAADQTPPGP